MLSLIVGIALSWYFFNFIENNSYIKNVIIYAVSDFAILMINQAISGSGFAILSNIIASVISGLIIVKIMEFTKAHTNSLLGFIILNEILMLAISFGINFILALIF